MAKKISIDVTPSVRHVITSAVQNEYNWLKRMGHDPDSMTVGFYPEQVIPLANKFKADAVDLFDQEVAALQEILCEYRSYLEGRLGIELAPEKYTKSILSSLETINTLLEILR